MTTRGYVEDDELILYAMQALSREETAAVTQQLAASEATRERLANIRQTLGVYAEAVAEPVDAPAGSLDRLLASIARDRKIIPMPQDRAERPAAKTRTSAVSVLPWAGWAIAAALLVGVGFEYQQGHGLRRTIMQQDSQLQQATVATADVARERDALQGALQQESDRSNASRAEASAYKDQSSALSARVDAESTRAQRESSRAADLASVAAANAQESARLKGTIASQDSQVAQLSAQAANGRQVLDALSDPTALRVTLTVPKAKKAPTGRGTYVPGRGTLLFTVSDLAPLPANKVYELWLLPADGSNPIPAGTFHPDAAGSATVVSTGFQRLIAAKGFAVTAEPAGGSQTPTMPILLAGA